MTPRSRIRASGPLLCALAALLSLAACGRGLPAGGSTPPPTGANVAPIIVDGGPPSIAVGTINLPFVTVDVCLPGTTTCHTVDHVLLDTGSTGLRLMASVLPANFNLPQLNTATGGTPLWECLQFVDGYSWGSVRSADVKIANGIASNQSIQLIGDPANAIVPPRCSANANGKSLASENTVVSFGANGVLGLNVYHYDCDAACADPAKVIEPAYYSCPTGASCAASAAALADQVQNPVYNFSADNNGVAIVMPHIATAGLDKASGQLVLGVNTQTNNQLSASAKIVSLDPATATFTTTYKGQALGFSFIDSGSNALYFNDSGITICTVQTAFYCPAQLLSATATLQHGSGAASAVTFTVDNLQKLSTNNPTFNALPSVAGSNALVTAFDWGLPFFYGRTVFVGFEGRSAGANAGPFNAF